MVLKQMGERVDLQTLLKNESSSLGEQLDLSLLNDEVLTHLTSLSAAEQMRYILENLVKGKGRCKFEQSTQHEYVDASSLPWQGRDGGDIQAALDVLVDFLNTPYINDGFGDKHGSGTGRGEKATGRRGWRNEMIALFGTTFNDVYNFNKYKWNQISNIFYALQTLSIILGDYQNRPEFASFIGKAEQLQAVCSKELPSGDVYDTLKIPQKKKRIEKVQRSIRDLLSVFR